MIGVWNKIQDARSVGVDYSTQILLHEASQTAQQARDRHGPHKSVDFAACRVSEEVGELVQAATSTTRPATFDRKLRVREEAIDSIAMIIRLVSEFPRGCE